MDTQTKEGYLPNIMVAAREAAAKNTPVDKFDEKSSLKKLSPEETVFWARFFDRPGV